MTDAPLRLGLLCHRGVGGSAGVARELAGELGARGHEVTLFARSAPLGRAGPPRVRLHSLDTGSAPVCTRLDDDWTEAEVSDFASAVCEVVAREQIDVLHFHYALPFAFVLQEVRARLGDTGPALVGTLHGSDVSGLVTRPALSRRLAHALSSLDALTTVSQHHASLAGRLIDLPLAPLVIPNFVDPDRYRPADQRPAADRPRLVHVSNFRPIKQTASMARIADGVMAASDADLWLVGDGEDLPEVEHILAARTAMGRVRRLGVRSDVHELLPHTDLLLLSSLMESFSLVALEAMACGVPVVAPRVGGIPELVDAGPGGLLYEPGDEGEATATALRILGDVDLQRSLREGAVRRARELATATVIPRYEELYRRVLARTPALVLAPACP